ncbi:hypothetical protein LTR70_009735 [Exophiala xenobiotica]|uniref:Uncharacterized protein n=1 Tax=Lithohypha guttulata TaxID=1690604 RepID=A0ABR0JWK9_9EURO|nr:hypothetical protein LTR24_009615 [Lithohypha guttulata]KAK5310116.1 hypothetical protein LTR70_009735 [Exophiala xenobiotica]
MAQASISHLGNPSAPGVGAVGTDPKAQSLLDFVHVVRNIANDKNFSEIETIFAELSSLKEKSRADAQRIEQLEAKLKEEEVNHINTKDQLEKQHDTYTRKLLNSYHGEVAEIKTEKNELDRKLSIANSDVKEKVEEATKLKRVNSELNKHIEDTIAKVDQVQKDLTQSQQEIAKLLGNITNKEETIQKQREDLSRQGTLIEEYGSEIKTLKKDLKALRVLSEKSAANLTAVRAFATPLRDDQLSQMPPLFNDLWTHCVTAVYSCFERDLHEAVLQNPTALDSLRPNERFEHQMPLALSNSVAAKVGRSTVAIAHISRLMVDHIFKPTCLANDDSDFRQELCYLALENPPKEAFTRALLVSLTDPEYQERYISTVVQLAHRQVKDIVDPDSAEKFRKQLQSIFKQAACIWRDLQSMKSHFEVDLDDQEGQPGPWKSLKLSGPDMAIKEEDVSVSDFAADPIGVKVFPRVFIVGPQGDVPVLPGKVIQTSQMAAMRREVADIQRHTGPWRRTTASLERRKTNPRRQNGDSFLDSHAG